MVAVRSPLVSVSSTVSASFSPLNVTVNSAPFSLITASLSKVAGDTLKLPSGQATVTSFLRVVPFTVTFSLTGVPSMVFIESVATTVRSGLIIAVTVMVSVSSPLVSVSSTVSASFCALNVMVRLPPFSLITSSLVKVAGDTVKLPSGQETVTSFSSFVPFTVSVSLTDESSTVVIENVSSTIISGPCFL